MKHFFPLLALLLVLSAFPLHAGAPMVQQPISSFVERYAAMEEALVKRMSDETLWQGPAGKPVVLECLRAAGVLRSKAAVPLLIRHVDYTPRFDLLDYYQTPLQDPDATYPVVKVLREIGQPAVQPILERMMLIDHAEPHNPDRVQLEREMQQWRLDQIRFARLAEALAGIFGDGTYSGGSIGKALARERIRFEAEKHTGKPRENLLNALRMPSLGSSEEGEPGKAH